MKVAVIGLGLIGGSMALALKDKNLASSLVGVDANPEHQQKALALGLVDAVAGMEEAVDASDLIVLAVPVNIASQMIVPLLNRLTHQVLFDVGSTKQSICTAADASPNRNRFVATHPMWGTEYSGPTSAVHGAFENKAVVICNSEASDADALEKTSSIYQALGMHLLYMDAAAHDIHAAYISHISHISSFALANTVLEKEREDNAIFEMASGGFESTVRLAKSNPEMWMPIFMQNKENILDVLNEHISQLRKFKSSLEKEDEGFLLELINNANRIRRIIK